jgi:hypothetical protein
MIQLFSPLYEELSEDIFETYLKKIQTETKNNTLITFLDVNADFNDRQKEEIIRLFTWANEQGLKGNRVTRAELVEQNEKVNLVYDIFKERQ